MAKKSKKKFIPWEELQVNKCPNCKESLMKGMFGGVVGCACGFVLTEETKDLLTNRDKKHD